MPDTIRVVRGGSVRWVNRDQIEHTVTGGGPGAVDASWSVVLASAGSTTTKKFERDATGSFQALRAAAAHMQMIADPLADAIAKQFPAKFADGQ